MQVETLMHDLVGIYSLCGSDLIILTGTYLGEGRGYLVRYS